MRSGIGGKFFQQAHVVVVAHHGHFRRLRHHGFREDDAHALHRRKHRIDVRAGFDDEHNRKRARAEIEVLDLLFHAIVENVEAFLGDVEQHLAARVAHRHRRRHFIHPHVNRALRFFGSRLPFRLDARLGVQRPRRRLGARGRRQREKRRNRRDQRGQARYSL